MRTSHCRGAIAAFSLLAIAGPSNARARGGPTKPVASAPAAAGPSDGAIHLAVSTFQLPNGLTVIVHEDHVSPVVTVNLWYHVGSKDERPGRTGFAHLFEHLMFQGSAHVGDDEHLRLIGEAGGTANATTNSDRTNFFQTVPSNFLARVLFLESDRMGFFVDALDQKKLDTQRDVVLNERRQRYENAPYGRSAFAIHAAIYPPDHPYHWLTIGAPEDLLAANLDDVKGFFRKWYTPRNATLAIAGDVKLAEAKALVEKHFADVPAGDAPEREAPPAPVRLDKDKRDRLEDRVTLERLYLTWPSPAVFQPGDAELDLLATILSAKSGRLYKRLAYELKLAQSIHVTQSSSKLGSLFQIVATAQPGHTAAELEKVIDEELGKLLGPAPLTADELRRAQNQWEARYVYTLQTTGTRANLLNQYAAAFGEPDSLARDRARYVDATVEGVQKVAAEVLGGHRHALVVAPPAKKPAQAATAPVSPSSKEAK